MYHWGLVAWTCGSTEPGSSGSPIFSVEDGFVVGHLHGGIASCIFDDGYDIFGALVFDWEEADDPQNQMKYLLDPLNAGILSMTGSYYATSSKLIPAPHSTSSHPVIVDGSTNNFLFLKKTPLTASKITYSTDEDLKALRELRSVGKRLGLEILKRQTKSNNHPQMHGDGERNFD
jgi:hypothetical protein